MQRRGFSTLEVTLVVGMVALLASITLPLYRHYQVRNDLNLAAEQISQAIGRARLLSQSGQDDAGWGYSVTHGILFQGQSYATRDSAFDEAFPMPSTITPSGLLEVTFTRLEGRPTTTGSIVLTSIVDEQRTINITINEQGIPVVMDDRLTICHKPQSNCNTLLIPGNAWPAHKKHGDTLGPCLVICP